MCITKANLLRCAAQNSFSLKLNKHCLIIAFIILTKLFLIYYICYGYRLLAVRQRYMEKKIWYELVQIKYGETYLAKYLMRQYSIQKIIRILTILFSGAGIFGWEIWKPIAWFALIIISLIQIISLLKNEIGRNDKDLIEIAELRNLYTQYFNKLEKLWSRFDVKEIKDQIAREEFYALREEYWERIETIDNKLGIPELKRITTQSDIETRQYLKTYF